MSARRWSAPSPGPSPDTASASSGTRPWTCHLTNGTRSWEGPTRAPGPVLTCSRATRASHGPWGHRAPAWMFTAMPCGTRRGSGRKPGTKSGSTRLQTARTAGCGGTPSPCEGQRELGPPSAPFPVSPGPFLQAGISSETLCSFLCRKCLTVTTSNPASPQCLSMCPTGHAGVRTRSLHQLSKTQSYLPSRIFILLVFPWALTMAIISSNNKHRGQRRGTSGSPKWFPDSQQHPVLPRTPCTHPAFPSNHRAPAGARAGGCQGAGGAQRLLEAARHSFLLSLGSSNNAPGVCRDGHTQPSSDPLQATLLFKILTFILLKKRKRSNRQLYQLTIYYFF